MSSTEGRTQIVLVDRADMPSCNYVMIRIEPIIELFSVTVEFQPEPFATEIGRF